MEIERILTQADYDNFARLSGDFNPIHVDKEFSRNSGFGKTVAHGIFLKTCLSGALEREIGNFTLVSSEIMFPAPTFTNVPMLFCAEVLDENDGVLEVQLISKEKQSQTITCTINAKVKRGFENVAKIQNPKSQIIIEPLNIPEKPFKVGQKTSQTRVFGESEISEFVSMGGAKSPENSVNSILINAMFSKLLGIDLPGLGTNYLKQSTEFIALPLIGETIIASVEITRIREDKKIIDFATIAKGEDGKLIAKGRALVSARDVKGAF